MSNWFTILSGLAPRELIGLDLLQSAPLRLLEASSELMKAFPQLISGLAAVNLTSSKSKAISKSHYGLLLLCQNTYFELHFDCGLVKLVLQVI